MRRVRWSDNERAGEYPPALSVPAAFTSRPVVRKAHGTAGKIFPNSVTEPRPVGLAQTVTEFGNIFPIAVLEQPSPRGMEW
jgi:hypothetical protein